MHIYITRHGETDWNVQRRVQGRTDIELNEKGKEQARIAKKELENEKIDLIICSPLKRTMQTAQIINEERNIPIIYDERIIERDFGVCEGKYQDEFDFIGFWDYKENLQYEKAEDMKALFDRVYNFLDRIEEEYKDKAILLVTHGGIAIPTVCYFNGLPEGDSNLFRLAFENCQVMEFKGRKKGCEKTKNYSQ